MRRAFLGFMAFTHAGGACTVLRGMDLRDVGSNGEGTVASRVAIGLGRSDWRRVRERTRPQALCLCQSPGESAVLASDNRWGSCGGQAEPGPDVSRPTNRSRLTLGSMVGISNLGSAGFDALG